MAETSSSDNENKCQENSQDTNHSMVSWQDKNKRDAKKRRRDENIETTDRTESSISLLSQNHQVSQSPSTSSNSVPPLGYSTTDSFNSDVTRRPFPMMQSFNIFPPINHPWPVNPMDGMNMPTTNSGTTTSAPQMPASGVDMAPASMNPTINPYAYMGMPADPMYGMMGGMSGFCPYPIMNGQENMVMAPLPPPPPVKEVITLAKCVLYPPPPTLDITPRRERPLGCKTVFVGGLPELITEEIVREMFERHGEIVTIRMSKKNFCHIRFSAECYVDQAFFLSGYRIKIDNKDDASHFGRLHVDYAQARDDQYEYECQQRALQREARHRERMEQEALRPPTPPPVVHYSDHEASILGEKLRNEDSFKSAVHILITWLERGECTKRNAGFFYSMIQSTNSHVRRLMIEKGKSEEALNKAKLMLQQKMSAIALQFNEIDKVFDASSLQKVWDHFTKAQRKNIELWKKQTTEIKKAHSDELIGDRVEDEMDLSDGEEMDEVTDDNSNTNYSAEELTKLHEDNDLLRNRLRAAQENVDALQNEKTLLVKERNDLRSELEESKRKLKSKLAEIAGNSQNHENCLDRSHSSSVSSSCNANESETRITSLVSSFLIFHPLGAGLDYICSYLAQFDSNANARDVESLLKRFPALFKEECTGIGPTLQKKWFFLGFKM